MGEMKVKILLYGLGLVSNIQRKAKGIPMETLVLKINEKEQYSLKKATEILKLGGLVAFPTETVYGLGADGLNKQASKKIYAAKGRPSDNPLILHIADWEQLQKIARDISEDATRVMRAFWPGPLTVILNKKEEVPYETTGGLDTVAVRMPSHPIARRLLSESQICVAAPSANTSGRPSPTSAKHVFEDMDGKIDMIIDGGSVGLGLESTIVDFTSDVPTILRPGFITIEMLREIIPNVVLDKALTAEGRVEHRKAKAPGMKYKHYAPKADLTLVKGEQTKVIEKINELAREKEQEGYRVGVIGTEESISDYTVGLVKNIGKRGEEKDIAANLYRILREFDESDVEYIYSEVFEEEQLGQAIMNRLKKAAGYQMIRV